MNELPPTNWGDFGFHPKIVKPYLPTYLPTYITYSYEYIMLSK
jgi:hypothetical protein